MIKLHWMQNQIDMDVDDLKKMSENLNESKYYSVLLPFHSEHPDMWMQAAHIMNKSHKLKYMIAFRPYHVSPQYFAMLVTAFNKIDRNRLIINMLAGDVHNRSDEDSQMDVYGNTEELLSIDQRKVFVRNFLHQCKNLKLLRNMPNLVISGLSDFSIETAKMFDATTLCMYDDYLNNIDRFGECSKKMVSVKLFVRETLEESNQINNLVSRPREKDYSIFGTEDIVLNKIKELIQYGVTDLLIGSHHFDKESYRIHNFVKNVGGKIGR